MELKDLVGQHMFSGIDFTSQPNTQSYRDYETCEVVNFVLDGITYTAVQDTEDGYRSCMDVLLQDKAVVLNVFEPVPVLAIMKSRDTYQENDVLELYSLVTGKIVFEVGTENTDDYYPCWVASFHPENI